MKLPAGGASLIKMTCKEPISVSEWQGEVEGERVSERTRGHRTDDRLDFSEAHRQQYDVDSRTHTHNCIFSEIISLKFSPLAFAWNCVYLVATMPRYECIVYHLIKKNLFNNTFDIRRYLCRCRWNEMANSDNIDTIIEDETRKMIRDDHQVVVRALSVFPFIPFQFRSHCPLFC